MRLLKYTLAFLILVFTVGLPLRSETTIPVKLSLADAVSLALDNTVAMKQAHSTKLDTLSGLRRAEIYTTYGVTAETGMFNSPDENRSSSLVSSNLTYSSPFGTTASLALSPFADGGNNGSVAFSVEHPLIRGKGKRAERYNQLITVRNAVRLSDRVLFNSTQGTVLSVVSAYYGAVLARDRVEIQKNAVDLAKQTAEYMRRREEAGREAGIQVAQSEVWALQAEESLNQTRQASQSALNSLMLAMGLGVGQTPELVDDVPDYDPQLPDVEEAVRTALANRLELSQLDDRISDQDRALSMKSDQLRPELDVTASWSSTSPNSGLINSTLIDLGSSYVGLKVSLPLDKRILREDRASSARALDNMKLERSFAKEQIANEVREAHRDIGKARTSLGNLNESLKIAEREEYFARRRVEEGIGIARDVVSAQQNLAGFRNQIKSAKLDLYLAHLRLKRATGEDISALATVPKPQS